MSEPFLIVSCPVSTEGVSRSEKEVEARCDQIEKELRVVMPVLAHLKAGRLTRRVCPRAGGLMVDFELAPIGQENLKFSSRRNAPPETERAALLQEFQQLVGSLRQTQFQMNIVAAEVSRETLDERKRFAEEKALRKLMRQKRGRRVKYDSVQGELQLDVPEVEPFVVDSRVRRITCQIISVSAEAAIANSITLPDGAPGLPSLSRKAHYRLELPSAEDNLPLGASLLASAFRRKKTELAVHMCYEPLLGVVTHFLIAAPQSNN